MSDIAEHLRQYQEELHKAVDSLDPKTLTRIAEILGSAYREGRQVFIIGNGGSAATASHLACDLSKGILGHKGDKQINRFRAISLTDNVAVMTAWANDTGYEGVFAQQLRNLANTGDVMIAISASGNSPSIIQAVEAAKELGVSVVALAGFDGGALANMADISLVADSNRYDISEDLHMVIGHLLTRYFFDVLQPAQ